MSTKLALLAFVATAALAAAPAPSPISPAAQQAYREATQAYAAEQWAKSAEAFRLFVRLMGQGLDARPKLKAKVEAAIEQSDKLAPKPIAWPPAKQVPSIVDMTRYSAGNQRTVVQTTTSLNAAPAASPCC